MENNHRLKVRFGPHEFDAEGSEEFVNKRFEAFREMVASMPKSSAPFPQITSIESDFPISAQLPKTDVPFNEQELSRIMKVEGRVVSLTARPANLEEAVLLLLLGQRILRSSELCTGGEIMEGLTVTGGYSVLRIDRLLEKLGRQGDVVVIGEHRAKRYRLANTGTAKARAIAGTLLATV